MVFSARPRESLSSRVPQGQKLASHNLHNAIGVIWVCSHPIWTMRCASLPPALHGNMPRGSTRWNLRGIPRWCYCIQQNLRRTHYTLRNVLQRLKEHGVKLKPKKCTMFKREVLFLGRVVSEGYKLDPSTVAPTLRLKDTPPKTINETRKLMGFLTYYRRYIEKFSRIAKLIYDLIMSVGIDKTYANPRGKRHGQPPPNQSIIWTTNYNQLWRNSSNVS